MDKQLKQRLIGAAVVVALAVIIVPELIKEPAEQERPVVDIAIPPRPVENAQERRLTISLPPEAGTEATEAAFTETPVQPLPAGQETLTELPAIKMVTLEPPPPTSMEPPEPPKPAVIKSIEPPPPATQPTPPPAAKPRQPLALPEIQLIAKAESSSSGSAPSPDRSSAAANSEDWMVQAGSFSRADNADRLRDRLVARGFPAVVQRVALGNDIVYRVRIGPHGSRDESEQVVERLQRVAGLSGSVVRQGDGW